MSKTTITYKDVAPEAADDASVSANGASSFSDITRLPGGGSEIAAISGELNYWALDGKHMAVDGHAIAFWSTELSGADGVFVNKPVITITFTQQHSSMGVSFRFDTATGGYVKSLNIKWYQGATLKANENFAPNDAVYFCEHTVTSYDKLVITLNSTNLPYRYAKISQIIFGLYRSFGMTAIRSASVVNEMDGSSLSVPVSTLRWTLESRDNVEYMFQLKQPVEVRNDNKLIGVYYIDGYSRTAESVYNLDCYDAFGVLDESDFPGGVYTNKSAKSLLEEIVGGHFTVTSEVADTNLTGAILPCTRREAAQQVLFAWGVCASTDGRDGIRVFSPGSTPSAIGTGRTYSGASVEVASIVTAVKVAAHAYTQDANGSVEIGGARYKDTTTVYTVTNPDVTATDKPNVVEVTGATLVSATIGQSTAQRVYDYYQRRSTNRAKIVWDGEMLGDSVTVPNAWGGTTTGNVQKMEIKLSNTVAASCEVLGV